MLPNLADAYGVGPPSVPWPLSVEHHERFVAAIRNRCGPEVRQRDYDRLEQARAIPLDETEQRWVAWGHDTSEDPTGEYDLRLTIELALNRERAYDAWRELVRWLTRDEQAAIVRWAQAVKAAAGSISPELMRPPSA